MPDRPIPLLLVEALGELGLRGPVRPPGFTPVLPPFPGVVGELDQPDAGLQRSTPDRAQSVLEGTVVVSADSPVRRQVPEWIGQARLAATPRVEAGGATKGVRGPAGRRIS